MSDDSPNDPKSADAGEPTGDRRQTSPSSQPDSPTTDELPTDEPAAEAPASPPITHERFAKAAASRQASAGQSPGPASSESEAPGPEAPGADDEIDAMDSDAEIESLIDYPRLIQRALRAVVHDTLLLVSEEGLPGDHHFYIDFETQAMGTQVPDALRQEFPELMRIVLQRQFWNLAVDDDGFEVDLRFGGRGAHLRVPFHAVTAFVDPAANLVLRFDPEMAEEDAPGAAGSGDEPPDGQDVEGQDERPQGDAEVVSIEAFRKRDS